VRAEPRRAKKRDAFWVFFKHLKGGLELFFATAQALRGLFDLALLRRGELPYFLFVFVCMCHQAIIVRAYGHFENTSF
jgi:hypothetical protein